MSRCTGHCCRNFHLSGSTPDDWKDFNYWGRVKDGEFISDMLIPLGQDENGSHRYTCRHHDKETGDCKVYQQRPGLCRDYPYGMPCEYKECTEGSLPDVPLSRFGLKSLGLNRGKA